MTSKWDVVRALKSSSLAPPSRLLMMMLIDAADAGTAEIPADHTPSLSELEEWTGLGRSTIARRLNDLEAAGWVVRERPSVADARSKGAKTRYRLAVGKDEETAAESAEAAAEEPETEPESGPTAGLVPERDQPGSARAGLGSPTAGPVVVPERDSFFIAPHTPPPPTEGVTDAPQQPPLIDDSTDSDPPPNRETLEQRVNRITKTYTDKVKLTPFVACRSIVKSAIKTGEYADEQIIAGLEELAEQRQTLTANWLRTAIEGDRKRARSPDWRDVSNQNTDAWTKGNR